MYRSLKCFRDGKYTGARLEASLSLHYFLDFIFAIEGRVKPYYKYLEWELKHYPLSKFKADPDELIGDLLKILETADIRIQQKLLKKVEETARNEGYGDVIDEWGEDFEWMKNFKLENV